MRNFFIKNFGCTRRGLDAERIKNYLLANGLTRTDSPKEADYSVAVTCGLTRFIEDECIKYISEAKKRVNAFFS